MPTVARQVRERLWHEGGQETTLLRHRVDHVAEEDRLVGGTDSVVVLEVQLELAVGIFVIVGVVAPAETIHVLRQLCDEVVRAGDALHVVTGLIKRVEIVGQHDLAVALLEQEELELHAHLEAIAHLLGTRRGVLEDRARAEVVGSAIDRDVAGEAGEAGLKRHRRVRLGVGNRRNVGRGR